MGGHGEGHTAAPIRAVCPVCGTKLDVGEGTPRATYGGKLYYFVSEDHLREFLKDPAKFPSQPNSTTVTGHEHGGGP